MGYCKLWIDKYTNLVKFLYDKLIGPDSVTWDMRNEEQFKKMKNKLIQAPVLSLPQLEKPFELFVNAEEGIAHGVLTQEWCNMRKPVAYLSKLLDPAGPLVYKLQLPQKCCWKKLLSYLVVVSESAYSS